MADIFTRVAGRGWRAPPGEGPRCIDLFCGAGGLSVGFAAAGFTHILAVDHDAPAVATYRRNFGDHVVCGDVRDIVHVPRADVIIGGPPCQGFSRLGKQAGKNRDEINSLWRQFFRFVRESGASAFLMENVPDIAKSEQYEFLQEAVRELGFFVDERILNAADYGVPQKRTRWFMFASRGREPRLPRPEFVNPDDPATLFSAKSPRWRTVRDAIGDLPLQPDNLNRHDRRNPRPESAERYKHIPPGGCWKDIPKELIYRCWRERNPRSGGMTDIMGRLRWDRPALTIRTQYLKPEKGCYLHPEDHRAITVREGMRIQTFPDDFEWVGSNFQVVKQVGNAVPCLLAFQLASAVKAHLAQEDVWYSQAS